MDSEIVLSGKGGAEIRNLAPESALRKWRWVIASDLSPNQPSTEGGHSRRDTMKIACCDFLRDNPPRLCMLSTTSTRKPGSLIIRSTASTNCSPGNGVNSRPKPKPHDHSRPSDHAYAPATPARFALQPLTCSLDRVQSRRWVALGDGRMRTDNLGRASALMPLHSLGQGLEVDLEESAQLVSGQSDIQ
jgi:hypothetical protein